MTTRTWTAKKNDKDKTVYFYLNDSSYDGKCYQSSYDGNSNKWLPFGFIDDTRLTQNDYALETLDDSYFLNCYWN